jgi:LGFP repeat-containing protein
MVSACAPPAVAPVTDVLTEHNDAARSGANLGELRLTPGVVRAGRVRRLYERDVDGGVVAQPLVVHGVPTARGRRNVVLVATETSWVYAFDLDDEEPGPAAMALAARQLQPTGPVRPPICRETPSQRVGITATPTVDAGTGTMFVVARNADDHQYYLHALDIAAALVDRRTPVRIATAAGGSEATFHPECQRNRPALLLQSGTVFVAFGSLACDRDCADGSPYHGWVFAYRARDLAPAGWFRTSGEEGHAGIWQGGSGLCGDGTRVYFQTGNGPGRLGDAFVALRPSSRPPGLELLAAFQPASHDPLDRTDADLGSGGPVWLPPGFVLGGGKQGRYYLLDAATLAPGPHAPGGGDGLQAFANSYHADPRAPACGTRTQSAFPSNCDASPAGCFVAPDRYADGEDCGPNINGAPVVWNDAGLRDSFVYQMAGRDFLKSFRFDRALGRLDPKPFATSNVRAVEGMAGGAASLSADGGKNAILWMTYPLGDAQWQNVPGRLAAFDALTLQELWHDDGGYLCAKFTPPTVAGGRIVRATLSGKIVVYGLPEPPTDKPWWRRMVDQLAAWMAPRPPSPPAPRGRAAVDDKYRRLGGEAGFLGAAVADAQPVQDARNGWYRDFRGVAIGAVASTVAARPARELPSAPSGERVRTAQGTPFESSIYWSSGTGAHDLTGEIRAAWLGAGGPTSVLGYPVDDEHPDGDRGRACEFERGAIRWSEAAGARVQVAR